jgi:hypothetical protein
MKDFYQLLGVGRDASAQVVRIAFDGRMKQLDDPDYRASAAERRAEERLLRDALATLTLPAKKDPYDAKLAAAEDALERNPPGHGGWVFATLIGALVAIALGGYAYENNRRKEIVRLEAARIAVERERIAKQAEIERERLEDNRARNERQQALSRERYEQTRLNRDSSSYDSWRSNEESRLRQADAQQKAAESRARYERQREEDSLRRSEEEQRRTALRELERQKEAMRNAELEEERIRKARYERVQAEERERERVRQMERLAEERARAR